jgi:hypothetical protein
MEGFEDINKAAYLPENPNFAEPRVIHGMHASSVKKILGFNRSELIGAYKNKETGSIEDPFLMYERRMHKKDQRYTDVRKLNEQEASIFEYAKIQIPFFLKQYGLEYPVALGESAIRVKEVDKHSSKDGGASWSPSKQQITVFTETGQKVSPIIFAVKVVHEIIHSQSFTSVNAVEAEGKLLEEPRRSGISIDAHPKKTLKNNLSIDYFGQINEAVTELLTRQFIVEHLEDIPGMKEEFEVIEEGLKEDYAEVKKLARFAHKKVLIEHPYTLQSYGDENPEEVVYAEDWPGAYWREIDKLKLCISDVLKKVATDSNTEYDFKDEEDVFKFISKAYFSGRLLPLARLLKYVYPDKSFGEIGDITAIKKPLNRPQ